MSETQQEECVYQVHLISFGTIIGKQMNMMSKLVAGKAHVVRKCGGRV